MPRLLILRQTPANGSPVLNIARRISPGRGASGLERAKRRVRDPVGSRTVMCELVASKSGSGKARRADGGGGYVLIGLGDAVDKGLWLMDYCLSGELRDEIENERR